MFISARSGQSGKVSASVAFVMEGLESRQLLSAGDFAAISKQEVFDQTSNATPTLDVSNPYVANVSLQEDTFRTW